MKKLALIAVILAGYVMICVTIDLPPMGSQESPPSRHISAHFISQTESETSVPNIVTAVLADYRGFDTMLETAVIFIAGIAIMLLLRCGPRGEHSVKPRPGRAQGDLIIQTICRLMVPINALFALYVVGHGHHSPGGGFQGGVILGASVILLAMAYDLATVHRYLNDALNVIWGNIGVMIFVGTGVLCLFLGANFLDYAALDPLLPGDAVAAHSHSMLIVEIGVAITCMTIMFSLYADLASSGHLDEGL